MGTSTEPIKRHNKIWQPCSFPQTFVSSSPNQIRHVLLTSRYNNNKISQHNNSLIGQPWKIKQKRNIKKLRWWRDNEVSEISRKDGSDGNDEDPKHRRKQRMSGGSGSRSRSCGFNVDDKLHLMSSAVVSYATNVPLLPFRFQHYAVLSARKYLVVCREAALLEFCPIHFHHVVLRLVVIEPCPFININTQSSS